MKLEFEFFSRWHPDFEIEFQRNETKIQQTRSRINQDSFAMELNNQQNLLYGTEMYLDRIKLPSQHAEETEIEDEEVEESDDDNNNNGPTKKTEKAKWSADEVGTVIIF